MLALLAGLVVVAAAPTGATVAVPQADMTVNRTLCRYDVTEIPELSGLASSLTHRRTVWAINDSGGGAVLFALSTRTCRVRARVRLRGVQANDFEAIAATRDRSGRGVLWVGDIGDNRARRDNVVIYRVPEPRALRDATVRAVAHRVSFPDGPRDAEALLADPTTQRLWLLSKRPIGAAVYRLPLPLPRSSARAERVSAAGALITDAAMSPTDRRFVIRDYFSADIYSGSPPGRFRQRVALPDQVQGEAITWTPDGSALLVASERDPELIRVELP